MITLNKKLVLVLCLALLSTQASAQLFGKKEPPKPVTLVPATDRAQAFNELITTGQVLQHVPKIYSGTNKEVAIASLVLEFVTDTAGSSSRGNVMDDRTSTTQMNYKLLGVSPQVMQAIADEFYDHVKQAIMAQGYTVVDQDKLLAIPKFAELVKDTGTVQTGGGLLSKDEFSKATSKGTADLTGVSGGFKKVGLMQSLGLEAPLLLSANIIINFAQFKDIGSSVWTAADQTRSGVQGAVQLAVTKGSGFDFSNAAGSNGFAMVRTTILPSQIAAKVDKVSLSGGQFATMALSMLTKSSVSNNNYEVTAVDNYKELASADLKMFAEVMAQGLKKQ